MSYNAIDITKYNFENEFVNFIDKYQEIYKTKVLQDAQAPLEVQNNNTSKKKNLKTILEDIFFSPKYDNVLDAIGLTGKKPIEG